MHLNKKYYLPIILAVLLTIIVGLYLLFKPKASSNGISGFKASFANIVGGNAIFNVTFTSPADWGNPSGSTGVSYTSLLVKCSGTCPTTLPTTGTIVSTFTCTTSPNCTDANKPITGTVSAPTSGLTQGSTYVIFLQGTSTNKLLTGYTASTSVLYPVPPPTAPSSITGLTATFNT